MADFFIRRPIVAMVIAILTVIVGVITLKQLPISEYPPVSPTMIQVTTTYRGAAAEAVMESVATPIESKVNGVDKLLYLQSYNANDGKLTLNVYFDVGTDVDIMQVNTQNRVGQAEAQLPEAVKKDWENIVTCCITCNRKKGGRTPEQAGMRLVRSPRRPSKAPAVRLTIGLRHTPDSWRDYLYWNLELDNDDGDV